MRLLMVQSSLSRFIKSNRVPLLVFVLAFAGIGTYFIVSSRAATVCTTTISSNLSSAINSASGGDTICLNSGSYGAISLSSVSKSSSVTVEPVAGATATLSSLTIGSSNHVNFQGLTIGGVDLTGSSRNIAITNSAFTDGSYIDITSAAASGAAPDVVLDSDTFNGINQPADGYEGRVQFVGTGSDVQISNSHFGGGGCSDGIQTGANGGDIGPGNVFTDLTQVCAATVHHVDPLQIYGGNNLDIHGNYFADNGTGIMAPDGGDNQTISDNVFDSPDYPPLTLGSNHGDIITHNTTNGSFRIYSGNSGENSTDNTVTNNIIGGGLTLNSGALSSEDYNIIPGGDGSGAHDINANPTYVGGANPATLAGWQLASTSKGINAASDGTNIGAPAITSGSTVTTPPPSSSDTTPPTVSLSAPSNGATVSGTVAVSASASDNVGVSSVQFQVAGANVGTVDTSSPYSYSWDTTKVSNGSYKLTAVAQDAAGNSTTSSPVNVTVNNPTVVTTSPTTSSCFSSPGSCGYPDPAANNVGAANCSSLTPSGSITKTTEGQQIKNSNITGSITVTTNNVTINNVCVTDNGGGKIGSSAITVNDGVTGTTISNSTVAGANTSNQSVEAAIAYDHNGNGGTVSKDYFYQCGECVHGPWTVNDSYVISNGMVGTGDHYEDWYFNDATISANHDTMFNPEQNTAVVFGDTESGGGGAAQNHITFTNSLVGGSGYAFYPYGNASSVGNSSNIGTINISNNRFTRCLLNGAQPVLDSGSGGRTCPGVPITLNATDGHGYYPFVGYYGIADYYATGTCQTWSGNYYDDNMAVANITDDGSQGGLNIIKAPASGTNYNCTTGSAAASTSPTPTTPTGLNSTGATTTSISLSWTDTDKSVGGYQVYRNGALAGTTTSTSFTDTGLAAGTGYSYTIEAYDGTNTGNLSLPTDPLSVSTTAAQQTLSPASQLTGSAPNSTTVNLSWTASSSKTVSNYYVVRSSPNSAAATIASLGNVTSYSDTSVSASTPYTYYILAGDGSGNFSSASNTVTVSTPAPPVVTTPPAAPSTPALTALAISSTQINLSWTASTYPAANIAGYYVYRSDKGSQPYATLGNVTTWGESDLTAGTKYTYTVKAFVTTSIVSALSAPASATTTPASTTGGGSGSGGTTTGSGTTLLGAQTVSSDVDSNNAGTAEVFQATAATSGSASNIHVYLDSTSKSRRMTVGIYQDNSGSPGSLITQGTATHLKAGAWNTVKIPQVALTAKQTYWIAVLGVGRGSLSFRDASSGTSDTVSTSTSLTSLPSQWTAGTTYNNSPLSAYATN